MKPGEVYDKNGVPIYPGDLLRTPHYRGRRRKMHYLYHTAIWNAAARAMEVVPTMHLEPTLANDGGRCWIRQDVVNQSEIINGSGPGDLIYCERPKHQPPQCGTETR